MTPRTLHMAAAFLSLCSLTAAAIAHSQNVYAAIHGTVTDSAGALLTNASITVVNTSTNITTTATSNSLGYYIFPQLQVGGRTLLPFPLPGFRNSYKATCF